MDIRPALLVIADIGGYTAFMKANKTSLAHAQDIVGRLLEAVIDAAPNLTLLEIEGDAAFFYAWKADGVEPAQLAAGEMVEMHRAFHVVQQGIETFNHCSCEGCTQAKQLTVKFVAHVGEVAVQRVKRVSKLVGLEVILVHRMLKNTVPLREYILMSEQLFESCSEPIRTHTNALTQEFEGLGAVMTYFVDIRNVAAKLPPKPRATKIGILREHWGLVLRSLPYLIGVKKPKYGLSV